MSTINIAASDKQIEAKIGEESCPGSQLEGGCGHAGSDQVGTESSVSAVPHPVSAVPLPDPSSLSQPPMGQARENQACDPPAPSLCTCFSVTTCHLLTGS